MTSKTKPPKPTTVLLVRHGTTPTTGRSLPGRAPGLHLADDGVRQAERAGERLAELARVDAVYCSPLERTRETAAPIGKALGLRPKVARGLLECDFGDWTGAELKDLFKLPEWRTVRSLPQRNIMACDRPHLTTQLLQQLEPHLESSCLAPGRHLRG